MTEVAAASRGVGQDEIPDSVVIETVDANTLFCHGLKGLIINGIQKVFYSAHLCARDGQWDERISPPIAFANLSVHSIGAMAAVNPILIDLPMPITTPRLLIRPPTAGDGAELHESVLESLESLVTYMPWSRGELTPEKAEENIRQSVAKWALREDLRLSIFDKATGLFAGGTGLHRVNWEIRSFEIGYWVRKRFEGKGYIKESTVALTRYAFDQLKARRVELRCNAENHRSISVIRRLGFELEGRLRNADPWVLPDAPCKDTLVFSRLDTIGLP